MIMQYYAMIPCSTPFPIEFTEASKLNENGYDIYWTVNEFSKHGERKKEFLKAINSFYIDVDLKNVSEEETLLSFKKYLTPNLIIKTKNGFHVYWHLSSPIDCSNDPMYWSDWYREFLDKRILLKFNADPNAKDVSRLLRAPDFKYWKDGIGDFTVKIIYERFETYTLNQICNAFPERVERNIYCNDSKNKLSGNKFWDKANSIDVIDGLKKLSGRSCVNGETYDFKKTNQGYRILINGKPHSPWIDNNGDIGSTEEGGPRIPNWLYYFHRDWGMVAKIMKEIWPELGEIK